MHVHMCACKHPYVLVDICIHTRIHLHTYNLTRVEKAALKADCYMYVHFRFVICTLSMSKLNNLDMAYAHYICQIYMRQPDLTRVENAALKAERYNHIGDTRCIHLPGVLLVCSYHTVCCYRIGDTRCIHLPGVYFVCSYHMVCYYHMGDYLLHRTARVYRVQGVGLRV